MPPTITNALDYGSCMARRRVFWEENLPLLPAGQVEHNPLKKHLDPGRRAMVDTVPCVRSSMSCYRVSKCEPTKTKILKTFLQRAILIRDISLSPPLFFCYQQVLPIGFIIVSEGKNPVMDETTGKSNTPNIQEEESMFGLPTNYTAGTEEFPITDKQRHKCLSRGWHVKVSSRSTSKHYIGVHDMIQCGHFNSSFEY